ncbi:MAG: HupE/UreJ family protein, partial [Rhodospirillaceae bacterium]|nr:HupE/UreJ family protein [Rhodospirillaceae bacterium]
HGFGFAYALRDMLPFGGDHLAVSLLAFNVGVEIGQLLVVLVCVPLLRLLFRYLPGEQPGQTGQPGQTEQLRRFGQPRRIGAVILSVLAGHTAWHWLVERGSVLWEFDVLATTPDGALYGVAGLLVLMLIIAAFAGWAFLRSDRTGWLDRTVKPDQKDQKDQADRPLE